MPVNPLTTQRVRKTERDRKRVDAEVVFDPDRDLRAGQKTNAETGLPLERSL